jgi:hypothetical protein
LKKEYATGEKKAASAGLPAVEEMRLGRGVRFTEEE